jgi:hypothetical protein
MSPTSCPSSTTTFSLSPTCLGIDETTMSRGVYLVFSGHGFEVQLLSLRILHGVVRGSTETKSFKSPVSDFFVNVVGGVSKIDYVSNIRYCCVTISVKDFNSGRSISLSHSYTHIIYPLFSCISLSHTVSSFTTSSLKTPQVHFGIWWVVDVVESRCTHSRPIS